MASPFCTVTNAVVEIDGVGAPLELRLNAARQLVENAVLTAAADHGPSESRICEEDAEEH